MRNLKDAEVDAVCGAGTDPALPPVGVTAAQWADLAFRLEWERKNPYRQEN